MFQTGVALEHSTTKMSVHLQKTDQFEQNLFYIQLNIGQRGSQLFFGIWVVSVMLN